jgi:NitT/TauT family transport system substrate-binding protein
VIAALREGAVDVGFSNVASLLFAVDKGARLKPLTGGAMSDLQRPVHGVFVRADSEVRRPADLQSQRIAVNTVRAIDEVMLSELIRRQGGSASSNRFVPLPFAGMQAALLAGEVDAIVAIEPFVALAAAEPRLKRISTLYAELQPSTEISAFVAREELRVEAGSPAARLSAALRDAAAQANRQPALVRELLPEYVDVSRSALQRAVLPHFMERQLSRQALDSTIEVMQQAQWIGGQWTAEQLLPELEAVQMNLLRPEWLRSSSGRPA